MKQTLTERARMQGINYGTLMSRINRGWDREKALMTPVHKCTMFLDREAAIQKGYNKFEGSPCRTCGNVLRYTSSYTCVTCQAVANEKFQAKKRALRLSK